MFDFLFEPNIEESGDYYIFRGLPYHLLALDFNNAFGSSYLPKAILDKINSYSFRVHKFFLIELHYTLAKVINQRKTRTPLDKLLKLKALIEKDTWFQNTLDPVVIDNFDKIKGLFKTKPYDLQELFLRSYRTITNAYNLKGLILDAAPGAGKTVTSLMWFELIGNVKRIVICPDVVVESVWRKEVPKHYKRPLKIWTTLDGTDIDPDAELYVIHYSALTSSWAPKLEKWMSQYVSKGKQFSLVIDECHNFNDENSKRSQLVTAWADMGFFSDTLPMSGTALKAQGRETYTVFTLIDKFFTKKARKDFLYLYGRSRENLNELLHHRIGRGKFTIPTINGMGPTPPVDIIKVDIPNADRYTLKNVRSEMLLYIEDRIKFYYEHIADYNQFFWDCVHDYGNAIQSNKGMYNDYTRYVRVVKRFKEKGFRSFDQADLIDNKFCKRFEDELMAYLPNDRRKHFKNIRSAVKYLGLKIRGEALGNVLGKMREEAATALIQHAALPSLINSAKKKTMIFTSYVNSVVFCTEYLRSAGFNPVTIYGETNHARDNTLKQLEINPTTNPGIATFDSLKEGVPCVFANQIILLNSPFRQYILDQVLARVWRKGQDAECFFWMLDLNTGDELNIASRSIDIMSYFADQVDQLMSKTEGYGGLLEAKGVSGMEAFKAEWIMEEPVSEPLYCKASVFDLF